MDENKWDEVAAHITFYSDSRCQKTIEITAAEVVGLNDDIPARHNCPIPDHEFFDSKKTISIRARCVWLLKLMSEGESVTDVVNCFLWKNPMTESVLLDSASVIYSCMSDLFAQCAFRYAEEKDKEMFRSLSEILVQKGSFDMAKEFDEVYLKHLQNEGFMAAIRRYVDSY